MIYEIRNYHYEPSLMTEYRAWVQQRALPYLAEHLDLVGFWATAAEPAEVKGKPLDDLGSATITWIIRWPDLAVRHETMGKVFAAEEWAEIMQTNPGREHYHRVEVRYADALL